MPDVQKEIVHYMHFNKLWYYWIDEYEDKKYWRRFEWGCDDINLLTKKILTERQCRNELQTLFPKHKIMKAIPFHGSPGPGGSRTVKVTVDRKQMLKEKERFREKLESFVE